MGEGAFGRSDAEIDLLVRGKRSGIAVVGFGYGRLAELVSGRCVFLDGRNSFDPAAVRAAGFVYKGIGR
jgi:hypothetical protein